MSVCFKPQSGKVNEKQVVEFWKQFPEIYNRIESEAVEIKDGMQTVQNWLNMVHSKYNVVNFVADHASVDMPWFRNLYLEHCDQSKNTFKLPWACESTVSMRNVLVSLGCDKNGLKIITSSDVYPHTLCT